MAARASRALSRANMAPHSMRGGGSMAVPRPLRLSAHRCFGLLAGARSGHLALSQGALPFVVPVTCTFCEPEAGQACGDLFVRAGLGLWQRPPMRPGVVAFGTSGESEGGGYRWDVEVQGRAELVQDLADVGEGRLAPPPLPLLADEFTTVLRVKVERVDGWEYGRGGR